VILRAAASFLLPGIVIFLALVGLYRLSEVASQLILEAIGLQQPGLPAVVGLLTVAVAGLLVAGFFWRLQRMGSRGYTYTPSADEELTDEELKRRQALAELAESMDESSPLRRVVAVGQTVMIDDVVMEVLALELREDIGRLTIAIRDPAGRAEEERMLSGHSILSSTDPSDLPTPLRPVVHMTDDAGTTYVAWTAGGAGSGANYRYDFFFGPAVPAAAQALTIVVERLTNEPEFPFPGKRRQLREIPGPWRFEVNLS
jgi:hypothetical protein